MSYCETFEDFMVEVDGAIADICGLNSNDLADWRYWDAWDAGYTPGEVAEEVLTEEGFYNFFG